MEQSNPPSVSSRLQSLASYFLRPTIGHPSHAPFFIRLAAGWVFVSSGVIKLAFVNQGPARFAKIGLPIPAGLAYFVGSVEIVCGLLLAAGLLVRLAAVPLAIDMLVAIATTKLPLLFGAGPEPVAALPKIGLIAFAYQSRLDLTMLAACAYLITIGSGLWSLDALLSRRRWEGRLMGERSWSVVLGP